MTVIETPIEKVRKGNQVVEPWSGVLVTVLKVKKNADLVVLEIGKAFCMSLQGKPGSLVKVWWRKPPRKERQDGED